MCTAYLSLQVLILITWTNDNNYADTSSSNSEEEILQYLFVMITAVSVTVMLCLDALTTSKHEGTLAHAVVIVHVFGAEVCSVDD